MSDMRANVRYASAGRLGYIGTIDYSEDDKLKRVEHWLAKRRTNDSKLP